MNWGQIPFPSLSKSKHMIGLQPMLYLRNLEIIQHQTYSAASPILPAAKTHIFLNLLQFQTCRPIDNRDLLSDVYRNCIKPLLLCLKSSAAGTVCFSPQHLLQELPGLERWHKRRHSGTVGSMVSATATIAGQTWCFSRNGRRRLLSAKLLI